MNKVACIVFLLFSFLIGAAQTELDSLISEFKTQKVDSVKLELAQKIVKKTRRTDLKLYRTYILEGIQLSTSLKLVDEAITFSTEYAEYLKIDSSAERAIQEIRMIEGKYKNQISPILQIKLLTKKADYFKVNNQADSAANYLIQLLKTAEEIDNKTAKASATIGLAGLFMSQKMYDEAFTYMLQSVSNCEEIGGKSSLGCLGVAYNNLSIYYNKKENLDSANHYIEKSIEIKTKFNNLRGLLASYEVLGNNQLKLNDTSAALANFENALLMAQKTNNLKKEIQFSVLLADVYLNKGQFSTAKPLITFLLKNESSVDESAAKMNYYYVLSQFYFHQQDFEKAFLYQQKKYDIADTLRNNKNATLISEMETRYETEKYKQEKAIADLAADRAQFESEQTKKTNLYIIGFTFLILVLLSILLSRFSIIKKQKKALNETYAQLEISKKNELAVSNLKALQSQMNPHFIFNALNSVQDLVLLQDIRSSNKYLGKFSDLIRKILLSSKEQFISLEEEIEILGLYLDLEKLRFGDDFIIDFKIEVSEQDLTSIELPAMFIQPYIENAIKHGLFHKEGVKELKVHFTKNQNYLVCVVEDNGVGQEKSKEYKEKNLHLHTGFSTEAINDRIRLLNETLKKKILLETVDLTEGNMAKGTRVTLQFPI